MGMGAGCSVWVRDGLGRPASCPRPVEWATDLPLDERPERRHREYRCSGHAGPDPRPLTVEDVAVLARERAQAERAAETVARNRAAAWRAVAPETPKRAPAPDPKAERGGSRVGSGGQAQPRSTTSPSTIVPR